MWNITITSIQPYVTGILVTAEVLCLCVVVVFFFFQRMYTAVPKAYMYTHLAQEQYAHSCIETTDTVLCFVIHHILVYSKCTSCIHDCTAQI